MLLASSPGRICLYGENADWLGGSVTTLAIDRRTRVEGAARTEPSPVRATFPTPFTGESWPDADGSAGWVGAVAGALRISDPAEVCDLVVTSDLPTTGGFASSASLCTALAAALGVAVGDPLDAGALADVAYRAERSLGIPCGPMDQYAVALGGLLTLDCSAYPPVVSRLGWPDGLVIIVGHLATRMRFASVVEDLPDRLDRLHEYAAASHEIVGRFTVGVSAEAVVRLIDEGHHAIVEYLGPIDPRASRGIAAALSAGALTAKSAGARRFGGGIFALCEAPDVGRVADAMRSTGLAAAVVNPCPLGTQQTEDPHDPRT